MLIKASSHDLIRGLCSDLIPGGVICLQYADDTILFMDEDETKAANLKRILTCFEKVSGMRINYAKSELIPLGVGEDELTPFVNIFGCTVGTFPIKYLGIPLHYDKLRREDIQPLIDKILKRMAGWRGKLLSYSARLTLIKACLASIPVYLLSFFKFPKWALDLINSQLAHCLWSDFEGNRKLHLANWHLVCMKKEHGGLGVPNIRDLNLCLLGSWVKRYAQDEGKIWKTIIDKKYIRNAPNIFASRPQAPSKFWQGVMWAARALKFGYRWAVGNGRKTRFWEDIWFGTSPLSVQFWPLYSICHQQCVTVSDVWDGSNIKLTFRRVFTPAMMEEWYCLEQIIKGTVLTGDEDAMVWQYESKGVYSSSSLYAIINFRGVKPIFIPSVWSVVVPPRTQVFLWLLAHNKLMTKNNLLKRGIDKNPECLFCSEQERVDHLFFECVVAKNI